MRARWNRPLLLAAWALLTAAAWAWAWASSVELPASALRPRTVASVRVTDRHGTLLREVLSRPDGRSTWVALAEISPHLVQATLAGEDQRFYQHGGVDFRALLRAASQVVTQQRVVSGGSTLTMQLARMLVPTQVPRSLGGKLRQAALAWELERRLTKEQILWQYLNRAPYGNGTFGVEAAARRYFNKPAAQLSLAEAALLSALPRSPGGYNPYRHRQRLVRRQRYILGLMRAQDRISATQQRLARAEPMDWRAARRPFRAPHLVQHVLGLFRARGVTPARVRTTLDLPLQQQVEAAVSAAIKRLTHLGVSNAAVLVVDNASGDVRAYVGSADFFHRGHSGQFDGTHALRQPGSTIKPLTYALALEQGKTPASLLRDLPTVFSTDRGDYAPRNYDGSFHGPVRLRVALGSSYNIPAVRLARFVGLDRLLRRLRALGLSSLTRTARHYGLGLTLGNGEVTLQELVAAYAALARGGRYRPPRLVLQARTARGRALTLPRPASRPVIPPDVAYLISDILSDPMARLPAFGRDSALDVGCPAAVKTGTSKDFRDNWTVGYTPQVTVGVWVGNFDGSSMQNVSGVTGAGPLWAEVMTLAAAGERAEFTPPRSLQRRQICPLSGLLPSPHCPAAVEEVFAAGTAPRGRCDFHRQLTLDRESGLLANPACSASQVEQRVMVVYPPAYRAWAARRGIPAPPTAASARCPLPAAAAATVSISAPAHGDRYFIDPDLRGRFQSIPLQATVRGRARQVRWLVNGAVVARAPYPYSARWPMRRGQHRIVAVLPDGSRSAPVVVTVR